MKKCCTLLTTASSISFITQNMTSWTNLDSLVFPRKTIYMVNWNLCLLKIQLSSDSGLCRWQGVKSESENLSKL